MTKIPHRALEIGRIRVQFFVKRTVEQNTNTVIGECFCGRCKSARQRQPLLDLVRYARALVALAGG